MGKIPNALHNRQDMASVTIIWGKGLMQRKYISVLMLTAALMAFTPCAWAQQQAGGVTIEWSQGIYHEVKKGDTLWDLSEKFYESPAVWPDMWSRNPDIANPHWIYPGEIIMLWERRGEEYIDLSSDPFKGVLPLGPGTYRYPGLDQCGFVRKVPVEPIGRIIKAYKDPVLIGQGHVVYIQPEAGQRFIQGDLLTIWRNEGPVINPFAPKRGQHLGYHHRILGHAVVVEVTGEVLVAVVQTSFRNIDVGDFLMPYRKLPDGPITVLPGKKDLNARIILEEDGRTVFGGGSIVFLDKGKAHGLATGQIYTAYETVPPVGDIQLPPTKIGQLLILLAEDETATALITRSREAFQTGVSVKAH